MELPTVDDLIKHLETLGRDGPLIVDIDGNTCSLTSDDVVLWGETSDDPTYPVALMVGNFVGEQGKL